MSYNAGDWLKITGQSGIYQTIVMLAPTVSQTVTFNFVDCTDGAGNYYPVVQIGEQLWMAENLHTTAYSDGTSIPNISDNTAWNGLTTGAYCDYNNSINPDSIAAYGHLYNWHAATDARNIAPTGWHVPNDAEWTILVDFLAGESLAGGKLKESCSDFGFVPDINTTNETGFTALPGGSRAGYGAFGDIGNIGAWWSTTQEGSVFAWSRSMNYSNAVSRHYGYKTAGCSLRCLKD